MRALSLLVLLLCFIPSLLALIARVPDVNRNEYGVLLARETAPATTTSIETSADISTSETPTPTAERNNTSTSTAPSSTTTIASLNTSSPSKEENGGNSTAPGALPIEPTITPALGISGFLLITTGAILALIGIRNLWIQVFLSSAFLTSLGVTVLIVYVMSPPVRVAIQGAYLVAVFFTGITFGALSIVFKELTEGLGCLLGGFCASMWLLSTKPGGLLTETNAKTGFIGAISVGFYALSFSHYTRPYGLIASTAIAGGTAVALGIDCYSRAGLKEFWLYIWALNKDIFPLDTTTYPVTRNIRVELAATVIIAVMGVVSQLRLWKLVRERREKEEEKRLEEQRKKDEAEIEAVKRLEENNLKERMEWEAKYGDHGTGSSSPSIPELPDGSRKCAADEADAMEKGQSTEMGSIDDPEGSYRCTECREMEKNEDTDSDTSEASEAHDETNKRRQSSQYEAMAYPTVFDGAAAAKIKDDRSSDVTAIVGSDAGSIHSEVFSDPPPAKKLARRTIKATSGSQEEFAQCQDDASSTQGLVDEVGDMESDCHTVAAESNYQAIENVKDSKTIEKPTTHEEAHEPKYRLDTEAIERRMCSKSPEDGVSRLEQPSQKPNTEPQGEGVMKIAHMDCTLKQETSKEKQVAIEEPEPNGDDSTPDDSPTNIDYSEKSLMQASSSEQCDDLKDLEVLKTATNDPLPQEADVNPLESEEAEQPLKSDLTSESNSKKRRRDRSQVKRSSNSLVSSSEKQDSGSSGEEPQLKHQHSSKSKKLELAVSSKQDLSALAPKSQTKPKKEEPAKLNMETVKSIPKQTSRIVLSYRTNEWAKHLGDADAPDIEPIRPFEEEQVDESIANKDEEVAAPVKVMELLQTPLNAQPPPAEPRVSLGKDAVGTNENHRMSTDSLPKLGSQKKVRRSSKSNCLSEAPHSSTYSLPQAPSPVAQLLPESANSSSTTLLSNFGPLDQAREEIEASKPQWKGPPPLIAVREDMVRNRLSSFSLGIDPYTRQNPGHSPTELSPRYSSTFTIPEEEEDDMPLSRRRTMLHQQAAPVQPLANIPSAPSRWSHNGAPSRVNSPAVLAAWRESVREDLKEKRNPLKLAVSHGMTGGDRSPSPFGQMQQRNASSTSIGDKIAEGMQRGDMSDLHREAMRRMQAKANQKTNGRA